VDADFAAQACVIPQKIPQNQNSPQEMVPTLGTIFYVINHSLRHLPSEWFMQIDTDFYWCIRKNAGKTGNIPHKSRKKSVQIPHGIGLEVLWLTSERTKMVIGQR
jgi:hypothetical protein